MFVKNAGQWELAGIMFATAAFGCQPANSAFHGNLAYSSDLAAYRDQIIAIVRPQCSDEIDNDGDLLIDYPDDPDCNSEFDDTEKSPLVPSVSVGGRAALAVARILRATRIASYPDLGGCCAARAHRPCLA